MPLIQHKLIETFPSTKFDNTKQIVTDVINKREQKEVVVAEHNIAYTTGQETVKQISEDYFITTKANQYFPNRKVRPPPPKTIT